MSILILSIFYRYCTVFLSLILLIPLVSCGTQTAVRATNPFPVPQKISAENKIQVRELNFSGALGARHRNLITAFQSGFTAVGTQLQCFQDAQYSDAALEVIIDTRYTPTATTKAKYIPILGGMMYSYSGGALNFDWEGTVKFTLYDTEGNTLISDSFRLTGEDCMENQDGMVGLGTSIITGAGTESIFYPDKQAQLQLGNEFLKVAGYEIAKRLRVGTAKTYFEQRTRERGGMDAKTYAEFIDRKQHLIKERQAIEKRKQQEITATIGDPNTSNSLQSGAIMVFGVGVDHYSHFPNLNYAASDCRKVVHYFKSKYHLTDLWAISLTDKDATAVKVNRFIKSNAARLLTKNDTFIFYFSGHGAPEPDSASTEKDGLKKYLLLSDSEPGALELTAISLNDLAKLLSDLPCRKVVIFIDSCFSGLAGKDVLSKLKSIRISEYTYKNIADLSGKGRVIIAASTENQVSQECDEFRAGVFTHYLIEGLNEKADTNGNSKVDVLELYNYVSAKVGQYTNGLQTPVFRGTIDRNFEF